MRRSFLLGLIAAAAAVPVSVLAQNHTHTKATAKNGGVMAEVNDIDYELVLKADAIRIYVSHHGKAVSLANASAKVTMLNGSNKTEATLAVAGDKLEAAGTFPTATGTRVVAVVTLPGKPAQSVRFDLK